MSPEEMDALISGTDNKSEKIRILNRAGVSKADIGKHLGIRYQHVYNVLLREGTHKAVGESDGGDRGEVTSLVYKRGQITLPQAFVEREGLADDDMLFCRVEDDGLKLMTRRSALDHLKEEAARRMPEQAALFEALLGAGESRRLADKGS